MSLPDTYAHQEEGIRWLLERETVPLRFGAETLVFGGLMCDDMGMGKTLQIVQLIVRRPVPYTLIVGPLAVLGQWRDCLLPWLTPIEYKLYICISRTQCMAVGTTTKIDIGALPANVVLLASYGQVMIPKSSDIVPLAGVTWNRIVLDEAHTIKNSRTATFASISGLATAPTVAKWAVTGTPVQNRLEDIYSLFEFIGLPSKLLRHKNIAAAQWLFSKLALRRTVADLDTEALATIKFPEAYVNHEHIVSYETEEEEEFYRRVTGNIMRQFERLARYPNQQEAARCRLELMNQLRFLAVHPNVYIKAVNNQGLNYPLWTGTVSKNNEVMRLVSGLRAAGQSFVLFTHFNEELYQFEEGFTALGYKVYKVHGGQTATAREKEIEESRTNSCDARPDEIIRLLEKRVPTEVATHIAEYACPLQAMLVHIKAGGAGLNLQHFSNIIIPSPDWNPAMEAQAIGRCHRIGQRARVNVYRYYIREVQGAMEQIEQYMKTRQEEKAAVAAAVVSRDETPEVTEEGVKMVRMLDKRSGTRATNKAIVVGKLVGAD